jgi:MFS family permease
MPSHAEPRPRPARQEGNGATTVPEAVTGAGTATAAQTPRRRDELRDVLRVRDFRLLWGAALISDVGDWAARLALLVVVYQRTGSPVWSAAVVTASLLPWVVGGPLLATLADRFPRRRVMVAADLLRAVVFALLLLHLPSAVLLVGVAVAGAATPVFTAARSAMMPELLGPERYPHGASLLATTSQLAVMVGYLAGGVGIAVLGARGALAANSVSFLLSAVLLTRMSTGGQPADPARGSAGAVSGGTLHRMRTAARALTGDRLVLAAVVLAAASQIPVTALESLAVVYSREVLLDGAVTSGVLCAVLAAGMALGALAVPLRGEPRRLLRTSMLLLAGGGAVTAVLLAGSANGPVRVQVPLATAAFATAGLVGLTMVPTGVVAFSRLPDTSRAAAAGLLQASVITAQAGTAALAGAVATVVPVQNVLIAACIVGCLPAVWVAARMRPRRTHA